MMAEDWDFLHDLSEEEFLALVNGEGKSVDEYNNIIIASCLQLAKHAMYMYGIRIIPYTVGLTYDNNLY